MQSPAQQSAQADAMVRTRVIVRGRVQGVAFRLATEREARARGLAGFVRNLPDGGVEAVFEGRAAAVEALVAWCRRGPPAARVSEFTAKPETPQAHTEFQIR